MVLNKVKSNYIIFSRSKEQFATRLTLDNIKLDRETAIVHLGIWITEKHMGKEHSTNL